MLSFSVILTNDAQSISDLIVSQLPDHLIGLADNVRDDFRMNCIIQAPSTNENNINIGSADSQPGFIIPGGSLDFAQLNLNKTFLRGNESGSTINDEAIILLLN